MIYRVCLTSAALLFFWIGVARADEPAAPMKFEVDATQKTPISRYIYGWNHVESWSGPLKYVTMNRLGGNRWTAYNWINNMSSAGSDWHFESDDGMGGGNKPGGALQRPVEETLKAGASILVTVPIAGYVADKRIDNAMNDPNHLANAFVQSLPRKNAPFSNHPTLAGGKVYQDEFVNWVESEFPARRTSATAIFYSLDNEPDLWAETHKEIHPNKLKYEELTRLNIEYGSAIKSVAPQAIVFGFASYGWTGFNNLQGAPDGNGRPFLDYYLDGLAQADKKNHQRVVDVLDLHWYSEATGGGKRITEGDNPEAAKARVQAPRSFWDPTYVEESWITQNLNNKPITLIPWLKEKIAKHYPGTKLSFSEYNHGGANTISGAIAEADTLGIFGREGVFAAALWPLADHPKDLEYQSAAINMFRNYDGNGGAFGDTSLAVTPAADPAKASLYASLDKNGQIVLVAINKTEEKLPIQINIKGLHLHQGATFYLTDAKPEPVPGAYLIVRDGSVETDLPPLSVGTIVLAP